MPISLSVNDTYVCITCRDFRLNNLFYVEIRVLDFVKLFTQVRVFLLCFTYVN